MSRLWFGGSFNPIHHAHLVCARAVAEAMGFSKIVLVPSGQPPHKPKNNAVAPAVHRLAMCRLAIAGSDLFEVDDLELHRQGASYTIDTVRALRQRGEPDIAWMIGADMLQILPQWHNPAGLMAETRFIIVARPGWAMDWQTMPPEYRHLQNSVVTAPLLEISATDIRKRVAEGRSIDYLTPPSVVAYIRDQNLYQEI